MPERDTTRVNDRIRVPEVRVIDEGGNQVGVMKTDAALRLAQERDLDLVEVAPEARPPVCRILDYSKYKYEQTQKQKAARKHQQQITIREIKFRPKIAEQDYTTKKRHVERFLRHKDKVKITIMFRGREVTHPERGTMILDRLAEELQELATIEQRPNLDGRNMTMLLGPSKAILAGTLEEGAGAADGEPQGDTAANGAEATTSTDAATAPAEAPTTETSASSDVAEGPEAEASAPAEAPAAEAPDEAPAAEAPAPADAAEAPAAEAADAPAASDDDASGDVVPAAEAATDGGQADGDAAAEPARSTDAS